MKNDMFLKYSLCYKIYANVPSEELTKFSKYVRWKIFINKLKYERHSIKHLPFSYILLENYQWFKLPKPRYLISVLLTWLTQFGVEVEKLQIQAQYKHNVFTIQVNINNQHPRY